MYPFLKQILSVFSFLRLLGCALSVNKQTIDSKGGHVDKMRISYKIEGWGGGGFQTDALYDQGYTYAFFLRNEGVPKEYMSMGISLLHDRLFSFFLTLRNNFH